MGHLGGTKSIEVEAPIEACWALAADVASAPQWQSGMQGMKVLDTDDQGRATKCETSSDIKVRVVKTIVRFTYQEPNRVSWTQEKGDLKSLDGAWDLEDLGDGRTKVTYSLDGDPGRVLGMLLKGPVEGKVRDVMVNARPGEFKARVEA